MGKDKLRKGGLGLTRVGFSRVRSVGAGFLTLMQSSFLALGDPRSPLGWYVYHIPFLVVGDPTCPYMLSGQRWFWEGRFNSLNNVDHIEIETYFSNERFIDRRKPAPTSRFPEKPTLAGGLGGMALT